MRIENLEIKNTRLEVSALDYVYEDCDDCRFENGRFKVLISRGNLLIHAAFGALCAEKYIQGFAQ